MKKTTLALISNGLLFFGLASTINVQHLFASIGYTLSWLALAGLVITFDRFRFFNGQTLCAALSQIAVMLVSHFALPASLTLMLAVYNTVLFAVLNNLSIRGRNELLLITVPTLIGILSFLAVFHFMICTSLDVTTTAILGYLPTILMMLVIYPVFLIKPIHHLTARKEKGISLIPIQY